MPANHNGYALVSNPSQHPPIRHVVSTSVSIPPTASAKATSGPDGSPSTHSQATRSQVARSDRSVKRWVTAISSFFLIVVLLMLIRIQGRVEGTEFAPTHFQQRHFSFFEIPLLRLQITPIRRTAQTPATANYLRLHSLVKTSAGAPSSWHLVSISRGLTGETPAAADLLTSQLDLETEGTEYWRSWSVDHPQRAKVFWPIVQELALRELYILLPQLFELAQLDLSADELHARMRAAIKNQYLLLIEDLRAAQRSDLAEPLLDELIGDYPEDENLLKLRPSISE